MNKLLKRIISLVLVLTLVFIQSERILAAALEDSGVEIVSADMGIAQAGSNLEGYYSQEDWQTAFPEGLFVVEYSTYEVTEGGTDPENPEDVYLGIVIYRLGGNSTGSTVSYSLSCATGDADLYPTSLGTVEFEPQQTTAIVKIRIYNDDKRNGDQLLLLNLTQATVGAISDASLAGIHILDDEPYVESLVTISQTELVTDKSAGGVSVVVKRTENDTDYCSLHLSTADGTAVAGVDYEAVEQDVVFLPGQTEQTVVIPMIQSDEAFTQERYLTVTMSDLQGCAAASNETIRLNITNDISEDTRQLVSVDDYEADLELDECGSLTDSSQSVINTNDSIDRAALLRTVVGTVNGTAVQSLTQANLLTADSGESEDAGYWDSYKIVPNSMFECLYKTGNEWKYDETYDDGNENLLIASMTSYDLNKYYAIVPQYSNISEKVIKQYPNTAFGYLTEGGKFDDGSFAWFVKTTYSEADEATREKMADDQIYYLANNNYENVDTITTPVTYLLEDGAGERYPNTTGIVGSTQKLFYLVYDDEGWDDTNFTLGSTILYRAVIPFGQMDLSGSRDNITNFKVVIGDEVNTSYIQFDMDGFTWRIRVDEENGGGVGIVPGSGSKDTNENRYGFYVGSALQVEYKTIGTTSSSYTQPQYIYLEDQDEYIHNAAAAGDLISLSDGFVTAFQINLETLLTINGTTLQENYYMTGKQAEDHRDSVVGENQTISAALNKQIGFRVAYSLRPAITVNFASMPALATPKTLSDGSLESESAQKARVYDLLKNVVTFCGSDDKVLSVGYTIDLDNCTLRYDQVEFSYLIVNPEEAGGGNRIKSNLYDLDFQNFGSRETISNEICTQISGGVVFTMLNESATYVKPQISIQSVGVSSKTDTGFKTEYTVNSLADYVNFEVLHFDTEADPELSYYTVRFVISDIYVGSTTDGVKVFPVTVKYESTDSKTTWDLLSFKYKGGGSFEEARDTELTLLDSAYTAVDGSEVEGVDAEGYKPVLELVDYTANGYEYVLYIPTYYDYQNPDSLLMQTYATRFVGGDGISLVMGDYDKGDGAAASEPVCTVDADEMQYVANYVPAVVMDSEGVTMETKYFEEQRKFYTYNDNVMALSAMSFTVDTSAHTNFLSKIMALGGQTNKDKALGKKFGLFANSGPYVQIGQNQIVCGVKLTLNDTENLVEDSKKAELSALVAADPSVKNSSKQWNTVKTNSFSASLDAKVVLTYNELTHRYVLTKFTFTGSASYAFAKSIPFAYVFYFNIATKVSCAITTGGSQVLDYVDSEGNSHYRVTWNGLSIAPSIYLSAGVGIGCANVLSLEAGASFTASMQLTMGAEKYVAPQQEFDVDSVTSPAGGSYSFRFDGSWRTYQDKDADIYSYGNTLCDSTAEGDVLTITTTGTAFQLVGMACPDGGEMEITVTNADGEILSNGGPTVCSTYGSHVQLYKLLYNWQLDDYTSESAQTFVVTIKNISGKTISLDSIRIYNRAYSDKSTTIPASLDSASVRIAAYVKFSVLGISISCDPAYMLLNFNSKGGSCTIGVVGNTWTVWNESATVAAVQDTEDDSVPVLLATQSVTAASSTQPDYFNTGAYSDARVQSLLKGDISNTAKTQTLVYDEKTYVFYTVLDEDDSNASYYQLYCSVDGGEGVLVSDEIFVADFDAFINDSGDLVVAMTCSDSTVKSVSRSASGTVEMVTDNGTVSIDTTDGLGEALCRTCLKLVVLDPDSGSFSDGVVIAGTDGAEGLVQESNPVAVSTGAASVLFYTRDMPTDTSAPSTGGWTSFDESYIASDTMDRLMGALYRGCSELYYATITGSGDAAVITTAQVPVDEELEAMMLSGYRITGVDAVAYGDTVCVAYSAELPGALKDGLTGTLKQIRYRQGTLNGDGTISFCDVVVVDSVFDYDKTLTDIFGDGVTKLSSKYYNSESGETYDSIQLSNVQLELAVMTVDGGELGAERMQPCLFYQTNSAVCYADYESLQGTASGCTVGELYDGSFDDYVIAVSAEGAISLIYNDSSNTSGYTDTLYLMDYCPEDHIWNNARQLTYTDVFDEEAFARYDDTGTLTFDDLSAFVDSEGKVCIALKSSYAPFSYEYGAVSSSVTAGDAFELESCYDAIVKNENGEYIAYAVMPLPDYDSEAARTDVFMITFADRVTDVEVTDLELSDTVFVEGQEIAADVVVKNTGDYMIRNMKVSLYYYHLSNNSKEILVSQKYTGEFLAGDSTTVALSYTVGADRIPDNTLLGVLVTDSSGRKVYYDSYSDCYLLNQDEDGDNDLEPTYQLINNAAEICFTGTNVQIGSDGIMTYSIELANIGTENAENDVTVYFRLYNRDGDTDTYTKGQALFAFDVSASRLESGTSTLVTDQYDVSNYLDDGNLYYSFEIHTEDAQYDTKNDILDMLVAQQIPQITMDAIIRGSGSGTVTNGRIVRNLTLGDEIEISSSVLAQYFDVSKLRVYEIGTSCLSIDNSAQDGIIRVKVVELPNNEEGYIKLLFSLDGTVVNRSLYLHITNRDMLDLNESHGDANWTLSGENFVYDANYDELSTTANGSVLTFDFYGRDLKLYGNLLTDGGSFDIAIMDDAGNVLVTDTVSTAAQRNDYGMMVYGCEELDYGHYTVRITAKLSDGERLALDCAKYVIDTSDADTTPYSVVEYISQSLDAPLLSGRSRDAAFTLRFSKDVELAEGRSLSDITLQFREYEQMEGQFVATGNTVTFTASELNGDTLTLTAALSSTPGAVLVYALEDSDIPEGCLVGTGGGSVDTAIPGYSAVSYVLKESGIMSVMVADDTSMPNGSVQKSVQVKFVSVPDTQRLVGTKLLYLTEDPDGTQRTVEFCFAQMTDDPRVAVYRADELTLETEELRKLFRFQKGIVLNQSNYVLVTADGDYLENDLTTVISDTSMLDIAYEKLRAANTRLAFTDGQIKAYVTYPEDIRVADEDCYVLVKRTLTDDTTGQMSETTLTLALDTQFWSETTLVFAAGDDEDLPDGMTVTYELLSDQIGYPDPSQCVTRSYDGIAVNPALPEAEMLSFNTDSRITSAVPYVGEDGLLRARVVFSAEMDAQTLGATTLDVSIQTTEYTKAYTDQVTLRFAGAETVNGSTVAEYRSDVSTGFGYEEIVKVYTSASTLTVPEGMVLLTTEGIPCGAAVLDPGSLTLERTKAVDTQISLTPNGSYGYDVTMTVGFGCRISAATMTNVYAYLQMQNGSEDGEVYLKLQEVGDDTLTFVSIKPVILTGDQIITITAPERFADPYGVITDENGVAVSEILTDDELVWDMSGTGTAVSPVLSMDSAHGNSVTIAIRVPFNEAIAEDSFRNTTISVEGTALYLDGQTGSLVQKLTFAGVENGNVAVYTADLTVPADADELVFKVTDPQIATGSGALYNADKTVKLSADLPQIGELTLSKTAPSTVSIVSVRGETAESMEDVTIRITYPEPITVERLEHITLTAEVSGIGQVTFRGWTVENGDTLVLRAEGAAADGLSGSLDIALTDAVLVLTGEAAVNTAGSGLAVSLAVPDAAGSFVVTPDGDSPDQPDGSDSKEEVPKTGDLLMPALLLLLMVLAVLALSKKKPMD